MGEGMTHHREIEQRLAIERAHDSDVCIASLNGRRVPVMDLAELHGGEASISGLASGAVLSLVTRCETRGQGTSGSLSLSRIFAWCGSVLTNSHATRCGERAASEFGESGARE